MQQALLGHEYRAFAVDVQRAALHHQRRAESPGILDFEDEGIQVLNGRYGPYITNKEKNARVPKDREPKTLTLQECIELLEKAPARRGKKKTKSKPRSSRP